MRSFKSFITEKYELDKVHRNEKTGNWGKIVKDGKHWRVYKGYKGQVQADDSDFGQKGSMMRTLEKHLKDNE